MRIIGIDPGSKGAVALIEYRSGGANHVSIQFFNLPMTDKHLDYRGYRDLLRSLMPIDFAYQENVWPRSARANPDGEGMGFVSGNKFMDTVGALKGITACEIDRCFFVVPTSWKRMFGLLGQPKNASKATLIELYPHAAKTVRRIDRAEAGLIASYGAVKQGILKLEMVR